jgi:hypothetical protein
MMDAELRERLRAVLDAVASIEMTAGEAADALAPIIAEVEAAARADEREKERDHLIGWLLQSIDYCEGDKGTTTALKVTIMAIERGDHLDWSAAATRAQKEPSA